MNDAQEVNEEDIINFKNAPKTAIVSRKNG